MHRIQSEPFDAMTALAEFNLHDGASGALVQFFGIVRKDDDLTALELEHYPAMARKALDELEATARARWALNDVLIVHRVGRLEVGEMIMMVAVTSAHRAEAFAAADFLMDHLKSRVPIWKRVHAGDDTYWVDAKASDEDALKRW